jgi:hypothetical protein
MRMEDNSPTTTIPAEKIQEFSSITDRSTALQFAANMADYYENNELVKAGWESVTYIIKYPLVISDRDHFSKVEQALGPDVLLRVYKSYLIAHEDNDVIPMFLIPIEELAIIARKSSMTEDEFASLGALQAPLRRRMGYVKQNKPSERA